MAIAKVERKRGNGDAEQRLQDHRTGGDEPGFLGGGGKERRRNGLQDPERPPYRGSREAGHGDRGGKAPPVQDEDQPVVQVPPGAITEDEKGGGLKAPLNFISLAKTVSLLRGEFQLPPLLAPEVSNRGPPKK